MNTSKLVFKGVPLDTSEEEVEQFIKDHCQGVTPKSLLLYNLMGPTASFQHALAEFDDPIKAMAVFGFFNNEQLIKFRGREMIVERYFPPRTASAATAASSLADDLPQLQKFKLCMYGVAAAANKHHLSSFLAEKTGVEPLEIFFAISKNKDYRNAFVTYRDESEASEVKAKLESEKITYLGVPLSANYAKVNPQHLRKQSTQRTNPEDSLSSQSNRVQNEDGNSSGRSFSTSNAQTHPRCSPLENNVTGIGRPPRPSVSSVISRTHGNSSANNSSVTGSSVTLVAAPSTPSNRTNELSQTQAIIPGLDIGVEGDDLRKVFSHFGDLNYVYVSKPKPGVKFINGYVEFFDPANLNKMLAQESFCIKGKNYPVKRAYHKDSKQILSHIEKVSVSPRIGASNQHQHTARMPQPEPELLNMSRLSLSTNGPDNQSTPNCSLPSERVPSSQYSPAQRSLTTPQSSHRISEGGPPARVPEMKIPTLNNVIFAPLPENGTVKVRVKSYISHLDLVFQVVNKAVDCNLQSVLDQVGHNSPKGLLSFAVPGEVVLVETAPGQGSYCRAVVRKTVGGPGGSEVVVEDLDSCDCITVRLEDIGLLNDACLASPVTHFHGCLTFCEPLQSSVDAFNSVISEFLAATDGVDDYFYVHIYSHIFNWADIEIYFEENDISNSALSRELINEQLAREPETAEEWVRMKAVEPFRLSRGEEVAECTVVNVLSPSEIYLQTSLQVQPMLNYVLNEWLSIELLSVPNYKPFPMEVVCTWYEDLWQRANVLSVDADKATLFLIDWGDTVEQPLSKVRPLPTSMYQQEDNTHIPGLVIKTSLPGCSRGDVYTEDQLKQFVKFCHNDTQVTLKVLEVNKRTRSFTAQLTLDTPDPETQLCDVLELCHRHGVLQRSYNQTEPHQPSQSSRDNHTPEREEFRMVTGYLPNGSLTAVPHAQDNVGSTAAPVNVQSSSRLNQSQLINGGVSKQDDENNNVALEIQVQLLTEEVAYLKSELGRVKELVHQLHTQIQN